MFDAEKVKRDFESAHEFLAEAAKFDSSVLRQLPESRYHVYDSEETISGSFHARGIDAIANGEVCAVVLAGGQASRLGSSKPKGMYDLDLGFQDHNTLFALQAAQISRLQQLALRAHPNAKCTIRWIVMTSRSTDAVTREYIKDLLHVVGLSERQVEFIVQREIPCYDLEGNVIYDGDKVMTSPNGNGGIYEILRPYLPRLRDEGLKYFHVYCVDNVLCRVADPDFIGCCILKQADCAAKTVEKCDPHEKIGIISADPTELQFESTAPGPVLGKYLTYAASPELENLQIRTIEYSEISKEQAERKDPTDQNKLFFRAGNIANHFFTIDFLDYVCCIDLPYHIAKKNIKHKSKDNKEMVTAGIKLERFIFDVFPHSRNFLGYQVCREDEFAPLKNNETAGADCPSTCLKAIQSLHRRWLDRSKTSVEELQEKFAGYRIISDKGIVSPLVSYGGEDLNGINPHDTSGRITFVGQFNT